ncbi:MAG: hypothetical protein ACE5GE_02615 [Phycisphaerae bacterium]
MSVLKKAYRLVALMALLNLLVVGGLVGYLVSAGKLGSEQVEQVAAILRGEKDEVEPDSAEEAEAEEPAAETAAPARSAAQLDRDQEAEEKLRLQADRRRAELNQQSATIASARLEVTRQREALERRASQLEEQARLRQKAEQTDGFKKEMALLSSLKPREGLFYLLQKTKEDAASLMLVLPTRKAKRMVEAAKSPAQKKAMSDIMRMMRDMSPEGATLLTSQRP